MTDVELLAFLEWLRKQYLLASLEVQQYEVVGKIVRTRGLKVESIANQALIDQFRKDSQDGSVHQ